MIRIAFASCFSVQVSPRQPVWWNALDEFANNKPETDKARRLVRTSWVPG